MLNIKILDNGDLALSIPDANDREELQVMVNSPYKDYWEIMFELFEDYSCNGSYTLFDASQGNPFVGLTGAPCIAESMDYDDLGDAKIEGNFWYFADYQIELETKLLASGETVQYTLAK